MIWKPVSVLLVGVSMLMPACNSMEREPDISNAERAAQVLLRQGKYQKSFDAFMELRQTYPNSYIPLLGLARCSAMLGKSAQLTNQAAPEATSRGALQPVGVRRAKHWREPASTLSVQHR